MSLATNEEGKLPALPAGWSEAVDPETKRTYYWSNTKETSWERPTVPASVVVSKAPVSYSSGPVRAIESEPKGSAEGKGTGDEGNVAPLPKGWQAVVDETSSDVYFWCPATNETTWDRPTVEATTPIEEPPSAEKEPSSAEKDREKYVYLMDGQWRVPRCSLCGAWSINSVDESIGFCSYCNWKHNGVPYPPPLVLTYDQPTQAVRGPESSGKRGRGGGRERAEKRRRMMMAKAEDDDLDPCDPAFYSDAPRAGRGRAVPTSQSSGVHPVSASDKNALGENC